MNKNKTNNVDISEEQYETLITELVPAMTEFFNSDRGRELFNEYMHLNNKATTQFADEEKDSTDVAA